MVRERKVWSYRGKGTGKLRLQRAHVCGSRCDQEREKATPGVTQRGRGSGSRRTPRARGKTCVPRDQPESPHRALAAPAGPHPGAVLTLALRGDALRYRGGLCLPPALATASAALSAATPRRRSPQAEGEQRQPPHGAPRHAGTEPHGSQAARRTGRRRRPDPI